MNLSQFPSFAAAIALTATTALSNAATPAIANGGFESGLSSWAVQTCCDSNAAAINAGVAVEASGYPATHSTSVAHIWGDNAFTNWGYGAISQESADLEANTTYTVSFQAFGTGFADVRGNWGGITIPVSGNETDANYVFSTQAGGTPSWSTAANLFRIDADVWTTYSMTFNTGSTAPNWSIWFKSEELLGARIGNTGGLYLDNVSLSVTAVPEPETYAMMLAGLCALVFMGRRRSQGG